MKRILAPVFFVVVFIFSACENDVEKVNLIAEVEKLPLVTQKDAEILYSDSGMVRVRVKTPLLERYGGDDPFLEMKNGVHMEFFDETGDTTTKMDAGYAIKYDKKNTIEAKKNVVVQNFQGEKLNTEQLLWDQTKGMIYSNAFVKITTPDKIIMGEGMEANQYFTKYKIKKIKGIISVKNFNQ